MFPWFLSLILIYSLAFPRSADAIVILPALILIPIAKLIAVIIAVISVPTYLTGIFWSRIFKNRLSKVILVLTLSLIVLGLLLFLLLPNFMPDHPLY